MDARYVHKSKGVRYFFLRRTPNEVIFLTKHKKITSFSWVQKKYNLSFV
jgi:hypothetical protein